MTPTLSEEKQEKLEQLRTLLLAEASDEEIHPLCWELGVSAEEYARLKQLVWTRRNESQARELADASGRELVNYRHSRSKILKERQAALKNLQEEFEQKQLEILRPLEEFDNEHDGFVATLRSEISAGSEAERYLRQTADPAIDAEINELSLRLATLQRTTSDSYEKQQEWHEKAESIRNLISTVKEEKPLGHVQKVFDLERELIAGQRELEEITRLSQEQDRLQTRIQELEESKLKPENFGIVPCKVEKVLTPMAAG